MEAHLVHIQEYVGSSPTLAIACCSELTIGTGQLAVPPSLVWCLTRTYCWLRQAGKLRLA